MIFKIIVLLILLITCLYDMSLNYKLKKIIKEIEANIDKLDM